MKRTDLPPEEQYQANFETMMEIIIEEIQFITGDYEWLTVEDESGWTEYGGYVWDVVEWYLNGYSIDYEAYAEKIHPELDGDMLETAFNKTIERFNNDELF